VKNHAKQFEYVSPEVGRGEVISGNYSSTKALNKHEVVVKKISERSIMETEGVTRFTSTHRDPQSSDRTPLVSVVMPNLNKGGFIEEAIRSILSQTYKNLEVLVVDNGSRDSSVSWLEKFSKSDPRVRVLRENQQGTSYALNNGIMHSQGEFITIMASDDICHVDRIRQQVGLLNERNASVCYSESWIIDEKGVPTGQLYNRDMIKLPPSGYEGYVFHELIRTNFMLGGTITCAARVMKDNLFDTALKYGEDWDHDVRLARSSDFCYVPTPLYGYRVYSGNNPGMRDERILLATHVKLFQKWLTSFDDLDRSDRDHLVKSLWVCCRDLKDRYGMLRTGLAYRGARGLLLQRLKSSLQSRIGALYSRS
jgi:glycosyltransferase involved in cell wall biosynthesis